MALRALIVAAIMGLAGIYAHQLDSGRAFSNAAPQVDRLPATLDAWTSEDFPLTENVAAILGADVALQRVYRHPSGAQVFFFLAYFAQQQVNSQIHSPRHCMPAGGWDIVGTETQPLQLSRGPVPAARMQLSRDGRPQEEMYYWFKTRSGVVTGEYALKWDLVRNAMARKPTDAVFIRYSASIEDDAMLRDIMVRLDPHLEAMLAEIGLQ